MHGVNHNSTTTAGGKHAVLQCSTWHLQFEAAEQLLVLLQLVGLTDRSALC